MRTIIVGILPPAEHFVVQLCNEHKQITERIKDLVNKADRHNPGKRVLDEYRSLRNQQFSIEQEAQHLFNNN